MNILASATRQWNPGDEFILFGVQNLLGREHNWIIYDRNPDLLRGGREYSNSWKPNVGLSNIDEIVIAGSPQWMGRALRPLFTACRDRRVWFVGIGHVCNSVVLSKLDIRTLNSAKCITTRDTITPIALSKHDIQSKTMPCPALFAFSETKEVKEIKKIGFVLQSDKVASQKIPTPLMKRSIQAVKQLRKQWNVDLIYHYIDEFAVFEKEGRYSYDAIDYKDIYMDYDFIITTRLHGLVLASCLGIPGIILNDDMRCNSCAEQIPATIRCENNLSSQVESLNVAKISSELRRFKKKKYEEYVQFLKRCGWNPKVW